LTKHVQAFDRPATNTTPRAPRASNASRDGTLSTAATVTAAAIGAGLLLGTPAQAAPEP